MSNEFLDVIAQVDNEKVIANSAFVQDVLALVPSSIWEDPSAKVLDPATKGGEFLRACADRFWFGLRREIPNDDERRAHILVNCIHGISTEAITAEIARRTVYCDRRADGPMSIAREYFNDREGNIRFDVAECEDNEKGHCVFCGRDLRKTIELDTPIYPFIHSRGVEKSMHFNLIIGNPPYQLKDGGHGASARPLYHQFVDRALNLKPDHLVMVIPARWYTGGKGLDRFRSDMLSSRHIAELVDFPSSHDCFPDNEIAGGICVFRWSSDHNGPTSITRHYRGRITKEKKPRFLDSGREIFVRTDMEAAILDAVDLAGEDRMDKQVSTLKPFGLRTYERGRNRGDLELRHAKGSSRWSRNKLQKGHEMVNKWKVILSAASGAAKSRDDDGRKSVLSVLEILPPKAICTETYLVAGTYRTKNEAQRVKKYLDTKFARYLIGICGETQHFKSSTFRFVPDIGHLDDWTNEMLFDRYDLTDEQRMEILDTIKPRVSSNAN